MLLILMMITIDLMTMDHFSLPVVAVDVRVVGVWAFHPLGTILRNIFYIWFLWSGLLILWYDISSCFYFRLWLGTNYIHYNFILAPAWSLDFICLWSLIIHPLMDKYFAIWQYISIQIKWYANFCKSNDKPTFDEQVPCLYPLDSRSVTVQESCSGGSGEILVD